MPSNTILFGKMRWINKFNRLPAEEKKLLLEAIVFLFYSKVILFLPFRVYIKRLKPAGNFAECIQLKTLYEIRTAVSRANKLSCWQNSCLVKSFAARLMLQRRNIGSVLYLGLQFKDGKELTAHAWLSSGNIDITQKASSGFKEIYKA